MWTTVLTIALILNAVIGLSLFEWAWRGLKPIRENNEELDSKYYAYRRLDVKKWKKWKFQIGAATVLITRVVTMVVIVLVSAIITKVITRGVEFSEDKPLTGWRGKLVMKIISFADLALLFLADIKVRQRRIDYDYSYYLGPGYRSEPQPRHIPTIIGNHPGVMDILVIIKTLKAAFASKRRTKRIPLFGLLTQALGCIFIKRSGPIEMRDQSV